jgi:hypothetical protein
MERIQILNLLPQKGSRISNGLVEDLEKQLQLSREEMNDIGYAESGSEFMDREKGPVIVPFGPQGEVQSRWDPENENPKEVEIIPFLMEKITAKLKELESMETLPKSYNGIYDRLVMKKEVQKEK